MTESHGALPAHNGLAMTDESGFCERLRQYICQLSFSLCVLNRHLLALHMLSEMMEQLVNKLGSLANFW